MSYFKILRWIGGEGGDSLINSMLLSHSNLKSNCIVNPNKSDENGRTILCQDENFPPLINAMANGSIDIPYQDLINEIEKIREEKKDLILKSHIFVYDLPCCVSLLPSEKTMNFFISARIKKIGMINLVKHQTDLSLIKKDKESLIINFKNGVFKHLERIRETNEQCLFIDDLLTLNYDRIESLLEIEIKHAGRTFLKSWVEKQFELFSEELRTFCQ